MLEKIIREFFITKNKTLTVEGIGFHGNIKDVSAQTLNGVIKQNYVHSLAIVLNVKVLVHGNEVSELHSQVVLGHFVHLIQARILGDRTWPAS